MLELFITNLMSPVVLFFILGIIAAIVKSDLVIPNGLKETLSIYLLIAIGLKGGIELTHYSLSSVAMPIISTLFLGTLIPLVVFVILRFMKFDTKNAIALSATYGSVSIVTYGAAVSFLEKESIYYEGYMNALVVLLESPAIFVSLLLLSVLESKKSTTHMQYGITATSTKPMIHKDVIRESLFGKSVLLLLGSLIVGFIAGDRAYPMVKPLFFDLYNSILVIFLLSMGLIVGKEVVPAVKQYGWKLLGVGIVFPVLFGSLGVIIGHLTELSLGGTMLMGVLAGSASYIAAPAALQSSVPDANPSVYLGSALGITFPFNLLIGIPIYYQIALAI
ncbi:sodium-dependent bicarbonate transport family permease [Bacillus sp. HMF5848]|uniref:sodium-dependent bicarbonate transport family permease n=1 Tax=Bacillus sp. HMF5848 TaxID=2495421 RepID=UPI000F76E6CF|nr:sodium-dependent bicarbonate transport family permease [Bacillus sp. HMF5848]RSK27741.1 sodium-dependent bicarbonate transport family permease [Bacillus sp. HMF5848]